MGHTTVVMLYAPEGCRTVNIQGKDAWFEPETDGAAELVAGRDAKDYRTPFPALQTMLGELEIVPPRDGFTKTVVCRISGKAVATNKIAHSRFVAR